MRKITDQWDDAAERYVRSQEDSAFAANNLDVVKSRFDRLSGETVLDLGCGYGLYTEYFRSIGGRAVGIDGSSKMIGIAKERYPDSEFSVVDITSDLPYEDASFDIVFCNQVLMDIEDIDGVLSESLRVLKPGGIFYYSIVHPAFYNGKWVKDERGFCYAKEITDYLTPGSVTNSFWGETAHFHRPVSEYLNKPAEAGFKIEHILEPVTYDGKIQNSDIPLFLMVECSKTSAHKVPGGDLKVVRVSSHAERAGAYYVRIQAMAVKHHISLEAEIDEHDGEDTNYVIVLDDVLPVATARMFGVDDETAEIGRIVVLPEYRSRGLGKTVVESCEKWAAELGFKRTMVESRDNKTGFYEKMGYRITDGSVINGRTFNCIQMEKTL